MHSREAKRKERLQKEEEVKQAANQVVEVIPSPKKNKRGSKEEKNKFEFSSVEEAATSLLHRKKEMAKDEERDKTSHDSDSTRARLKSSRGSSSGSNRIRGDSSRRKQSLAQTSLMQRRSSRSGSNSGNVSRPSSRRM